MLAQTELKQDQVTSTMYVSRPQTLHDCLQDYTLHVRNVKVHQATALPSHPSLSLSYSTSAALRRSHHRSHPLHHIQNTTGRTRGFYTRTEQRGSMCHWESEWLWVGRRDKYIMRQNY